MLLRRENGSWTRTAPFDDRIGDTGVPDRRVLGRFRGRYRFGGIGRMAFLFSTFGCRYRCRLCTMSKQDGSIWVPDRGQVPRELELTTEPNVFLADFEPRQAPDALAELIDAIERRGIYRNIFMMTRADAALEHLELFARFKEAGLRWIFLGLDGHSQARLREQGKACQIETSERALRVMQELGLAVFTSFAVRCDFTRSDFAELRAYVRRLEPPMFGFTIETPLAGTRYFDDSEDGLTTGDWSLYDLFHAVLPTSTPLAGIDLEMTRHYVLAARMSFLGVLQGFPLRELLLNLVAGPLAIARTSGQAKDHGTGSARPHIGESSVNKLVGVRC